MRTATELAQQIADQELEACCEWLTDGWNHSLTSEEAINYSSTLRATRRPKPLSLAEEAKADLDRLVARFPYKGSDEIAQRIWCALDRLQELEGGND